MSKPKLNPDAFCSGDCDNDGYIILDPFGMGSLMDDHMEIVVPSEEIAKRYTDAVAYAGMMGGTIPGNLLEELGLLVAPVLRWKDIVSGWVLKTKRGQGKNDWTYPQIRQLSAGIYAPSKKSVDVDILLAYDCSGSMSNDDVAFIISQLGVIGKRQCRVHCVPFDTQPYWDKMVLLTKFDKANLSSLKAHGRGGTLINETLNTYEKKIGKMDIVIIGTDGYLADQEMKDVKVDNRTRYLWLLSCHHPSFKPPFGRVMHLKNE